MTIFLAVLIRILHREKMKLFNCLLDLNIPAFLECVIHDASKFEIHLESFDSRFCGLLALVAMAGHRVDFHWLFANPADYFLLVSFEEFKFILVQLPRGYGNRHTSRGWPRFALATSLIP